MKLRKKRNNYVREKNNSQDSKIVFLHINEDELRARCLKREANFENCLNMQNAIEEELTQYRGKVIKLEL